MIPHFLQYSGRDNPLLENLSNSLCQFIFIFFIEDSLSDSFNLQKV
ncbi:hypothetical protein LBBP_01985 [Leptospira borgpetersenii serovar Ballum]|uniref:Uncharacterized protein n=1 Tax=Leptospira borgpetersenii serovar Ballum TaxID=280505 RepID=A0A0S2IRG6_LEPBO|nr:hypothetical protein LBBP_01985 [Leptospira borgpetersenii serovar Ballum]